MAVIHPVPYGETITLHRVEATGFDEYGNDITETVDVTVDGVALWPRTASSREGADTDAATRVVIGLAALLPPGVAVKATDTVTARGALYEVDGEPGVWRSYFTNTSAGTELSLRRVEG